MVEALDGLQDDEPSEGADEDSDPDHDGNSSDDEGDDDSDNDADNDNNRQYIYWSKKDTPVTRFINGIRKRLGKNASSYERSMLKNGINPIPIPNPSFKLRTKVKLGSYPDAEDFYVKEV